MNYLNIWFGTWMPCDVIPSLPELPLESAESYWNDLETY